MKGYSTHIFCTPEVHELPQAYTSEIASLLDGVKSNHSFYGEGVIGEEIIGDKKDTFQSRYRKLSMNDCFELCQRIRNNRNDINEHPESFVVILTYKENDQKWFSATDGKNIYINVKDLELYSGNQTRYPIAFQILENLFQSICGIVYKENEIDERIHKKSNQCINDLCRQKSKIINKLKSAKICDSCKQVANSNDISDDELEIFNEILESIKTPAIIKFSPSENQSKPIKVDAKGNILINGILFDIEYQLRSIYILFLSHTDGSAFNDIEEYVTELAWIYQKVRNKGKDIAYVSQVNIDRIRNIIVRGRHNQFDPTFYRKVSEINNELLKQLDQSIVDSFLIKKDELGVYSIKLDDSKIDIDTKFKYQ